MAAPEHPIELQWSLTEYPNDWHKATTGWVTDENDQHPQVYFDHWVCKGATYFYRSRTKVSPTRYSTWTEPVSHTAVRTGKRGCRDNRRPLTGPRLRSAEVSTGGKFVDLTFDRDLDHDKPAPVGQFTVKVNGASVGLDNLEFERGATGFSIVLTDLVARNDTVTVSYSDPTDDDDDENAIQDGSGTDVRSFTDYPATNNSHSLSPHRGLLSGGLPRRATSGARP